MERKDYLFRNFSMYWRNEAEKVIEWYVSGLDEITIFLDDGSAVAYDHSYGGWRYMIRDLPSDMNNMSESEFMKEFSYRLRRIMWIRHIYQEEMSERTGISQQTISCYFKGRSVPSFYNAYKMSIAIGCKIDALTYTHRNFNAPVRYIGGDANDIDDEAFMEKFGIKLNHIMRTKRMRQKELSERTGISQALISRYINARSMPSFYNAYKITVALDCTFDDLT